MTSTTSTGPRSRRALLAGALGGLAAWAASTAARVNPAEAAAGDPIRMGRINKASSTATTLQTKTSTAAYQVTQIGGGAAVKGVATSGRAVMGVAGSNGSGIWGSSPDHNGVHGLTDDGIGVLGEARGTGTGVYAFAQHGPALEAFAFFTYCALFNQSILLYGFQDMWGANPSTPDAPQEGMARLFSRDDGTGKTQLCVRFPTGAVQVLATEP